MGSSSISSASIIQSTIGKTSIKQKTLTLPKESPIIGREGLLALVEWMRRRHEGTTNGDSGNLAESSPGVSKAVDCPVRTNTATPDGGNNSEKGDHTKEYG
jgi:hypothetical protein